MIVRTTDDRLQLITQPDHAHLAARIMEHCVDLVALPRRGSIMNAIAEHDNGWEEEDSAPMVDQDGNVIDFIHAPVSMRHRVWPRAVMRLSNDPFAAALVAQHAITVHERFRREEEWASFFGEMAMLRNAMVDKSGFRLDELAIEYAFVRLGDLISLSFCTAGMELETFGDWSVQCTGSRVVVTPDPFGGRTIQIEISAREIPTSRFQSDNDLRAAIARSTTLSLSGSVTGEMGDHR
jgi:hypothetical protein